MDMSKAIDELPILRDFIDFVNRQVGVYCDCLKAWLKMKTVSPTGYRHPRESGGPGVTAAA